MRCSIYAVLDFRTLTVDAPSVWCCTRTVTPHDPAPHYVCIWIFHRCVSVFAPRMFGHIAPGASHDFCDSSTLTHSRLAHQQLYSDAKWPGVQRTSPVTSGYPVEHHNGNVRFDGISAYWAAEVPATAQGIFPRSIKYAHDFTNRDRRLTSPDGCVESYIGVLEMPQKSPDDVNLASPAPSAGVVFFRCPSSIEMRESRLEKRARPGQEPICCFQPSECGRVDWICFALELDDDCVTIWETAKNLLYCTRCTSCISVVV